MPAYKYQHFVPCGYLKHFSVDEPKASKKSAIFRFNGTQIDQSRVKSECGEDWHYTLDHARERENMFGVLENRYGLILSRLLSNKPLSDKMKRELILMMFELHCRNPAYRNLTGKPNIFTYDTLVHCLRILLSNNDEPISREQLQDLLQTVWHVNLLRTSCEPGLITSDNPSLWFTLDVDSREKKRLHFTLLPVTPSCCAIAWDSRSCQVTRSDLNKDDQKYLNLYQLGHCTNFIYGPVASSPAELELERLSWNRRKPPSGKVTKKYCDFNFLEYKNGSQLSFLRAVE